MKIKKTIAICTSAILIMNMVAPYGVVYVQAKEVADNWDWENTNVPSYFQSISTSKHDSVRKSVLSYTNSVIPRMFNVPETNKDGEEIHYFAPNNLMSKSIQYVSFIETKHLEKLGFAYSEYLGTPRDAPTTIFKSNEIRKIYWNKSDFYVNDITIYQSVFEDNKIQSLDLPHKVIEIKDNAFKNNQIASIKGWEKVKTLGIGVFEKNKLVSFLPNGYEFTIPKTISVIPSRAFLDNELTYVKIPENVLNVNDYAFGGNPINSIYFENANTVISTRILYNADQRPVPKVTVYGHGQSSTAKTFAERSNYKYVDVDEYEFYVFAAEEAKTKAKIDAAYEKINGMEDSEVKNEFLKRLALLEYSFDIEPFVIQAEKTHLRKDYQTAIEKVNTLEEGTVKNHFTKRLSAVLYAIETKRYQEIKEEINKIGDQINMEQINELKNELDTFENATIVEELVTQLESKEEKAIQNTYKLALSYIAFAKRYPMVRNVVNAQKQIDLLADDYVLKETFTLTYDDPYLKDSDGHYVVNKEASYEKEVRCEDEQCTTDYKKNEKGEYVLLSGLSEPIYEQDPLYGQSYTITKETGSKTILQQKLDEFSQEIYAEAAVDIAEKYLTQEKIDDALILVLSLKDSEKKTTLEDRLAIVQTKREQIEDVLLDVEKIIKKYGKVKTEEVYNEALTKIDELNHVLLIKTYREQLEQVHYKNKLEAIIEEGELNGLTKDTKTKAFVYLALLHEEDAQYNAYFTAVDHLISEYNQYYNDYLIIQRKIQAIDTKDKTTFTQAVLQEIREDIYQLKNNNPHKEALQQAFIDLQNAYNQLVEVSDLEKTIANQMEYLSTQKETVTINELKNVQQQILRVSNEAAMQRLQTRFDGLVYAIVRDYLLEEYKKPDHFTQTYKHTILDYIALITNTAKREELKLYVNQAAYDIIVGDIIINMEAPEIVQTQIGNGYQGSMDDLLGLLDKADKEEAMAIIDNKVIEYIGDHYEGKTGLTEDQIKLLADLFNSLSEEIKNSEKKEVVVNVVNDYFTENYPNYNHYEGNTINDYKDMSTLYNYFDGIHFTNSDVITNHLATKIENDLKQTFNDNRISHLSETINNIGSIINQDVQANMVNKTEQYLKNYLQNLDYTKNNILSNLTTIGAQLGEIQDPTVKKLLEEQLKQNIQHHINQIYDVAVQNNNSKSFINFLSNYFTESEINKLIQNDHDNVIGMQQNDNKYYQDIIVSMGKDLDEMKKIMENLERIIASLQNNGNHLEDSSNHTISNDVMNGIMAELGKENEKLTEQLVYNQEMIQLLQDKIEELTALNETSFTEQIVALKAATVKENNSLKHNIQSIKNSSEKMNYVLIALGSALWLVLLLAIVYVGTITLRTHKNMKETTTQQQQQNEQMLLLLEQQRAEMEALKELLQNKK